MSKKQRYCLEPLPYLTHPSHAEYKTGPNICVEYCCTHGTV